MTLSESSVQAVLETGKAMKDSGLVAGTWGNISVRSGAEGLLITPSGMPYHDLVADDLVMVDLEGKVVQGRRKPSSEINLHLVIYRERPDVQGIVHTHSLYASVLAVTRKSLPPILEEMAQVIGGEVKVAPYAPAGTLELAEVAGKTLGSSGAVLLANHGVLGVGRTLAEAFLVCQIVEKGAQVYCLSQLMGTPRLLTDQDVFTLRKNYLESYGQKG